MAKIQDLVCELYSIVQQLEKKYPKRRFTPDGHLIGSIGECLIPEEFDLDLQPVSNKGLTPFQNVKKK